MVYENGYRPGGPLAELAEAESAASWYDPNNPGHARAIREMFLERGTGPDFGILNGVLSEDQVIPFAQAELGGEQALIERLAVDPDNAAANAGLTREYRQYLALPAETRFVRHIALYNAAVGGRARAEAQAALVGQVAGGIAQAGRAAREMVGRFRRRVRGGNGATPELVG